MRDWYARRPSRDTESAQLWDTLWPSCPLADRGHVRLR